MCNLYRMTSTVEAMRRLFAVEGIDAAAALALPMADELMRVIP